MADTALHSMTENTNPATTEEVYILDPTGPTDQRITMANFFKIINNMTEDTAPVITGDLVVTYDQSASLPKKVKLQNVAQSIVHAESLGALNPADSTTYYFGSAYSQTPPTSAATRRLWIPRAGTIRAVYGHFAVGGTLGSAETITVYIRVNNTTDATVSSTAAMSAATNTWSNASMTQAVSAGDYIEVKFVCPAFATNPTSVYCYCDILIG